MKILRPLLINCILIAVLLAPFDAFAAPPPPTPPPPSVDPAQRQAIEQAVQDAVKAQQPGKLFFMIYDVRVDQIQLSPDKTQGLAWLTPVNPADGSSVPTEPAIAVVDLLPQGDRWNVTLPTDPAYAGAVAGLPKSLLSPELDQSILTQTTISPLATQVFTGYYLPWQGGQGKILSGSIGHFLIYHSCTIASCRYAYDFYDGTRFPLEASKSGTVWAWYDGHPNDDHSGPNYLVLRDPTTNPVTYQLYYHLAQGTIPAKLKKVGTVVNRGDFIGNADNTGYSTGNHLHFMVYADPTTPGSSWGNSVDIVFEDVKVNGGRPRTKYEAQTYPGYGTQFVANDIYVSGNKGPTPPTGTLSAPAPWTVVNGPTVTVSGQGYDNVAVTNLQVAVDTNGTWTAVSPLLTANPFTTTVDLCAAGVPTGPLTLGLWVWDNEGTRTLLAQDARPIVMNYSCQPPPPACTVGVGQVGLFSLPDFQGACTVFTPNGGINNAGIYDTARLGAVGDNAAASVLVGANVMATLYDLNYTNGAFQGRPETFDASDAGLADNRLGAGRVSSLRVRTLAAPGAPALNNPPKVQTTSGLTAKDSFLLTWNGGEGGVEYLVELTNMGTLAKLTSPWLRSTAWSPGSLAAGSYAWRVTARNAAGTADSGAATFSVATGSLPNPTPKSLPYSDSMNNGVGDWVSSGLWRQSKSNATGEDANNTFWIANASSSGTNPSDGSYASSTVTGSDLTSPPIAIGQGVTAYLRFREFNHTESSGPYWDQRLVQVSANGGPFTDVYQMQDDPADWWVYSSYINLSAYAGQTIRVRFHFDTVDATDNAYPGWRIDDVTINTDGPDTTYAESAPNDSAATATLLTMNSTVSGYICPVADLEFYAFNAVAGQTVNFDIDAQTLSPASSLDSYIYLLDTDGKSVIAENDDEVPWQVRDSLLTYTFHRSGKYYLKIKAWSYPGSSVQSYKCQDFFYTFKMYGGIQPTVQITAPAAAWIGATPLTITAQAADGGSGMAKVDFLWHSPDWAYDTWELLASDTNVADGWSATLDPTGRTVDGSALVVRATNRAGLTSTAWLTDFHSDTTAPTTRLDSPIPDPNTSTVIRLTWAAADTGSGIRYIEIKYKDLTAGTDWQLWNTTIPGWARQAFFQGEAGHQYGFTIHGIDYAGNVESYDTVPETGTTIAAACTPDQYDAVQPSDGTSAAAGVLALASPQVHNFCPAGDTDWVSFTVPAAGNYLVRVKSVSGGAAAVLNVTTADGQNVLASGQSAALGAGIELKFTAPAAGNYKLRLVPLNTGLWGTTMQYSLWVAPGYWIYTPVMLK